jgi:hypothetical protein
METSNAESWLPTGGVGSGEEQHPAVALSSPDMTGVQSESDTVGAASASRSSSPGDGNDDDDLGDALEDSVRLQINVGGIEGDFDAERCRKCQILYENDVEDLLTCQVCSLVFHAGCEEPTLTWSPTEVFCSQFCFEEFKVSPKGVELFAANCMLTSGHLRKYSESMTDRQITAAVESESKPLPALYVEDTPSEVYLEPGQCVSLRAEPREDDPRTEWPAVIRAVYFHYTGHPLVFVTWLEPVNPTKASFAALPGGHAQIAPCYLPTCTLRIGEGQMGQPFNRLCPSADCRRRSNPANAEAEAKQGEDDRDKAAAAAAAVPAAAAAAPVEGGDEKPVLVKQPSRLRMAMSAADLVKPATTGGLRSSSPMNTASGAAAATTSAGISYLPSVSLDSGNEWTLAVAPSMASDADPVVKREKVEGAPMTMPAAAGLPATTLLTRPGTLVGVRMSSSGPSAFTPPVPSAALTPAQPQTAPPPATITATTAAAAAATTAMVAAATVPAPAAPRARMQRTISDGVSSAATSDSEAEGQTRPGRPAGAGVRMHPEYAFAAALLQEINHHHGATDSETDYSTQVDSATDTQGSAGDDDTDTGTDAGMVSDATSIYSDAPSGAGRGGRASKSRKGRGFNAGTATEDSNSEAEHSGPDPIRRPRASKAKKVKSGSDKDKDDESKRPIMCSCGRVFSNGQALGGHRGKCKVPRERMRQSREGGTGDEGEDTDGSFADMEKIAAEKEKKKRKKNLSKPPSAEQVVKHFARMGKDRKRGGRPPKDEGGGSAAGAGSGGKHFEPNKYSHKLLKPSVPPEAFVRPVYPVTRFDPRDYRIGKNEKSPQTPACIVKVHPYRFNPKDLKETWDKHDLLNEARRRYKPTKLDDMLTDTWLNSGAGAYYDEPELDSRVAVLTSTRDIPRKLAFIGADAKEEKKKTHKNKPEPEYERPQVAGVLHRSNSARATRSSTPTDGDTHPVATKDAGMVLFWSGRTF